ncbi:MAG: glycosyltransferase family 39 protein [Proteobacteria bacterium]|nr:glycosyltransferase family 39 protein [Pseudomonadota bacterium]
MPLPIARPPVRRVVVVLQLLLLAVAAWLRWPASPPAALWNDEAWRALEVVRVGTPAGLVAYAQETGFPLLLPGWILGKLGVLLFGLDEWAFRLWPLVFGVLGVWGAFRLAERLAGPGAGLVAAALVALGPGFVTHAREFKPYALDVCLTFFWLHAALAPSRRRGPPLAVTLFGLATALGSLAFVFLYPGVLALRFFHRRERKLRHLVVLALPGVVFLAYYALVLGPQTGGARALQAFWEPFYLNSWASLQFLVREAPRALGFFSVLGWLPVAVGALGLFPFVARKRRDGWLWLFGVPVACQVAFSALGLYPLLGRGSLHLYGLLIVAACAGWAALLGWGWRRARPLGQVAMAGGSLLFGLTALATQVVRDPYPLPDRPLRPLPEALRVAANWPPDMGRRALETFDREYADGDGLLVGTHGFYVFHFYRQSLLRRAETYARLSAPAVYERVLVRDETSQAVCRGVQRIAEREPARERWWILLSGKSRIAVYESVLAPYGRLEPVLHERLQGLLRLDVERPLARLACAQLGVPETVLLHPGSPEARYPVENFPRFFQLTFEARAEPGTDYGLELELLGEAGEPLLWAQVDPDRSPRRGGAFLLTHRDFDGVPGVTPDEARGLLLRSVARGGGPAAVTVRRLRVD